MNAWIREVPPVAVAVAVALAAGCHGTREQVPPEAPADGAALAAAGDEIAHYTCSMHPAVRNPAPGSCPMCSMALAPVFQRELDSGEIVLDAGRRQQIGVTTARAELRPLGGPVRASGTVTYDQSRLTDVTLKVGGWIDELHADRIGQRVKEGEPLFSLYSPDLFETQLKYVAALEKLANARKLRSPLSADLLLETRRLRLRLWDLGPERIEQLEDRGLPIERVPILAPASGHVIEKNVVAGASVAPGMRLLRIAGLDRVWVEADVYESELASLAVGDPATVTLRYLPGRELRGRIAFVYPWIDGATRTGRVRVELANPNLDLKPDMYAEVVFEREHTERLAVPERAVLYAGDRDFVFLDLGEGRFRPQAVTVGGRAGEWVEILDGVGEGDLVVTSGNFLVAAEARLALALEHWGGRENGREGPVAAASHAGHAGHGNGAHPPAPAGGAGGGHDHSAHSPPPRNVQGGGHDGHAPAAQPAAKPAPPADEEAPGHGGHAGHDGHDHGGDAPGAPPPDRANGEAPEHAGHGAHAPAAPPMAPAGGEHGAHAGHGASPPEPPKGAGQDGHGGHEAPPPKPPDAEGAGHDGHGAGDGGHGGHGGHDTHGGAPADDERGGERPRR